jgi:uncharacterized protein (TIGR03000 family)
MRYLLAAALSGALLFGPSTVVLAQHDGHGGHGGGGHPGMVSHGGYYSGHPNGYFGGYYGHGGYYGQSGYYGHGSYYGRYWYPGVGFSIGFPLWFNYPWGYSRYDYGIGAPYYSGSYYYGAADTAIPSPPSNDVVNAPAPALDPHTVNLEVRLPENATLWIQGQQSTETGAVRHFISPQLEPDKGYTYDLKARWTDSTGQTIERTKKVDVKAGAWIGVDFNRADTPASPKVSEPTGVNR